MVCFPFKAEGPHDQSQEECNDNCDQPTLQRKHVTFEDKVSDRLGHVQPLAQHFHVPPTWLE